MVYIDIVYIAYIDMIDRLLTDGARRTATEGSVLKKMDICMKLIGVFKHESAKHWPVLRDNDVYETMEEEEQLVEENFIKEELFSSL